jgi:hypothetical protein
MPAAASPPGWPADLPPADSPEFGDRVVLWLLDLAPAEFRGFEVLRRHPHVLGWAVAQYLDGAVTSLRASYSQVRATFADSIDAKTMQEVMEAFEFEGVRLAKAVRQVGMVNDALSGLRWRPRL